MIFGYGFTAGLIRIIIQFMDFLIFRSELSDLHCNFSLVCAYFILSQVYSNI